MKRGVIKSYGKIHHLIKVAGTKYWKSICAPHSSFRIYRGQLTKEEVSCEKCLAIIPYKDPEYFISEVDIIQLANLTGYDSFLNMDKPFHSDTLKGMLIMNKIKAYQELKKELTLLVKQ